MTISNVNATKEMLPLPDPPRTSNSAILPDLTTVAASLIPTVFHEPWWLDIASGGTYREATVSSDGKCVGRLPYMFSEKIVGLKVLGMPMLSHVLGPAVSPALMGAHCSRSLKQYSILSDLIAQLPKAAHAWFRLHAGITNSLAFEAAGFTTGIDFTAEIRPDQPAALWRGMRDKTRNVIRRAEEHLTVAECNDCSAFLDFYEQNLRQKGMQNHYNGHTSLTLLVESVRRGVGRILAARNAGGDIHAAIFTVWDTEREYYFLSTRSLESGNGAISLLIWHAMQHAAERGLIFDMDGFHVVDHAVPNLMLLTGFGGTIMPRLYVHRSALLVHCAKHLRGLTRLGVVRNLTAFAKGQPSSKTMRRQRLSTVR